MDRLIRSGGRLRLLCALTGITALLLVAGQVHGGPSPGIFGIYGKLSPGRDSIRVTKSSNGKIAVALKLYYSHGHTCTLSGAGEWREDHVEVVAEGLQANQPCKLSAFFDKGRVLLKDEGLRCAPVYCGTRGKLDDVSLPKSAAANPRQ